MKRLVPFHHFNTVLHQLDDPVDILEEKIVSLLRNAEIADRSRDSSIAFELKHSSGVLQFGRLLAKRRRLPPRSSAVGALLHDIYVILEGKYKDHAHLGSPVARQLMEGVGGFSESEIHDVEQIVYHHSDKHVYSGEDLLEFGKDADVLDCFLYPGAFDYYLLAKPLTNFVHYLKRARAIWLELSLPPEEAFSILDTFEPDSWLSSRVSHSRPGRVTGSELDIRPFAIVGPSDAHQMLALPPSGLPSEAMLRLSDEVAREADYLAERPDLIMVWPMIGRWQPLRWAEDAHRIGELGLADLAPQLGEC